MDADGSIVIRADLDDKQAQAELNRLTKKIDGLQEKLRRAQTERLPLVDQANELAAKLDEAKAQLDMMQSSTSGAFSAEKIAEQKDQVKNLQAQWDAAMRKVEAYDRTIAKTTTDIGWESDKAGELSARLAESGENGEEAANRISAAAEQVGKRIDKLGKRITGLLKQMFVAAIITRALRGIRTWFADIVTSNDEAAAAIARFKGALLTLAQPLVDVIIPAFVTLVNVITKVILAIASFVSGLFGKTAAQSAEAAQSLNDEKKAIKGVGGAAKKAEGQLAAFDQINKLTAEDAAGGGGESEIQPSFDFDDFVGEDELNNILRLVEAIGAALLAWKIGNALGMRFKEMIGLALLLYSTLEFIRAFLDAWNNGINMDNLLQMLLALAGAAIGAGLAFGTVGAAIALIVGGIALLAVGFKDLIENGMNLSNTLAIVAGLFATGLGISLLTGSIIPALIGALAAIVVALVYLFGEGELFTEGFRDIFEGLSQFFTSIFAGDMEGAIEGLKQAWEGLKKVGQAVANAIQKAWQAFLNWVGTTLGPKWRLFFEQIGIVVSNLFLRIKEVFNGFIRFFSGLFSGDLEEAWEGIKDIFKAAINAIIDLLEGFANIGITILNGLIDLLNRVNFDLKVPDWVPGIGGNNYHVGFNIPHVNWAITIPRLAQGAVIPPNREFMAVLGDQKSGTNIEAPLDTIVAAFRQAVREMGSNNDQRVEVRVYLDSREIKAGQQRLSRVTGG